MTNKHKHDHCKHENLQYCERCRVVHCLDCKHEFPQKETVYVEKIVYKDHNWLYPKVTWGEGANQSGNFNGVVPNKAVYDKDRFSKTVDACDHSG